MAGPSAPVVGETRKSASVDLDPAVFAAEVKPHLVHETVRAEMAAARAGSKAVKSRGLVAGGRSKPWRQKGTGRARAGTTRASQWTGGGVAFEPRTNFEVKVNRKARRAAFRGALSAHAKAGTFALVDGGRFDAPSTKAAAALLAEWGKELPTVVVAAPDEQALIRSFRNVDRVLATVVGELEVTALVWARSVLVTEAALPLLQGRAS